MGVKNFGNSRLVQFLKLNLALLISVFLFQNFDKAPLNQGAPDDQWSFLLPITKVKPFLKVRGSSGNFESAVVSNPQVFPWGSNSAIFINSNRIGTIKLFTSGQSLIMQFQAVKPLTVQMGVEISSKKLRPLTLEGLDAGTKGVHYYPYNWRNPDQFIGDRVVNDLRIPGAQIDEGFIAYPNSILSSFNFSKLGSEYKVSFYKFYEINIAESDRATTITKIAPSETIEMSLTSHKTLTGLQALRFGRRNKPAKIMTQLPVPGWGSENPNSYLTVTQYGQIADSLKSGGYDSILLRLNSPRSDISMAVASRGLTPYFYQFLGAARWRNIGDGGCYSLVFNGNEQCVTEWLATYTSGSETLPITFESNGSWAYLDLRRPEVRAALVSISVEALHNGYKGLFFDGGLATFRTKGNNIGGKSTNRTMSLYRARELFLMETRSAIRAIDNRVVIGGIANLSTPYVDGLGWADFIIYEMAFWNHEGEIPSDYRLRKNLYDLKSPSVLNLKNEYRLMASHTFFAGVKGLNGNNVAAVHKALAEQKTPSEEIYLEIGDVQKNLVLQWAKDMARAAIQFLN